MKRCRAIGQGFSVAGCADIVTGGTDLSRQADRMVGREQVILVDAVLDDSDPGSVSVFEDETLIESHRRSAHHLSANDAVRLLKTVNPSFAAIRFMFIVISVADVHTASVLSPELTRKLPHILDRVCRVVIAV